MNDELTLAYLAGSMDADGFFTMTRRTLRGCTTYSEMVGLGQLSDAVPRMLQERFGGYIQFRERKGDHAKNWRPVYYWAAVNRDAARAVEALRPFLIVKARQAEILLSLRASKNLPAAQRRAVRVGVRGVALNPEVVASRIALYDEIKRLNHNGVN